MAWLGVVWCGVVCTVQGGCTGRPWVSAVPGLSRIVESDGDTATPGRLDPVCSSGVVAPPGHLPTVLRPPVLPPLPQGPPGKPPHLQSASTSGDLTTALSSTVRAHLVLYNT